MSNLKSKHAFGSEVNIDSALQQGLIDAYDILFLSEGKVGWIDKNGNKVIIEDKQQVTSVDALPETGEDGVVYIYDGKFYYWDGSEFVSPASEGGVAESVVDQKIDTAKLQAEEAANAYTDEQIAAAIAVVEF